MAGPFGTGEFEFGDWVTPFTDAEVDILDLAYAATGQSGSALVVRVQLRGGERIYRLVFQTITALRLLDEGGLIAVWQKTAELGGRPGRTTFRVRNHAWTQESVIPFLASDGWAYVIATDDDCLEVVSPSAPTITSERAPLRASGA